MALARCFYRERFLPKRDNYIPIEALAQRAGCSAHGPAQIAVSEKVPEPLQQFIITLTQVSGLAINYCFGTVVRPSDHWQSTRGRFENYLWRTFPARRKQEDVCLAVLLHEFSVIQAAQQFTICQMLLFDL